MTTNSNVKINLSANVIIGGSIIPLSTDTLDLSNLSMENLKAEMKNISFGLPANTTVSSNLGALVDWIKQTAEDFSLPDVITDLLGDMSKELNSVSITINSFHITGAGHFDVSLVIHFKEGLDQTLGLPDQVKDWININDIGFTFSYDKPTSQAASAQ